MGLENICAMNRERQLIRTSRVVRLNSREDYYSDDAAMYPRLATATQRARTVYVGKGATEAAGPALGRVLLYLCFSCLGFSLHRLLLLLFLREGTRIRSSIVLG